jgi:6,7-dimethyl-8-ribityllumazine synthase
LCKGALNALEKHGVEPEHITVVEVPGAFEIPGVAKKLTDSHDAVICLGAVIRGDTPHFDQVVSGSTSGMMQAALTTGKPIINGILTTDTVDQALNRAGLKSGNKGWEAAITAIEMATLYRKLA